MKVADMKQKGNDFDKISHIYTQFNQKNKENLVKIAVRLLNLQKKDMAMIGNDALVSLNEKEQEETGQ
jgi:hypothetical protein